jgi:hemerythrin-like domain-containing protein
MASRTNRKAPGSPVDAVQLLEDDHAIVRDLAQAFDAATSSPERRLIGHQLLTALEIHAALEETIFYPAMVAADPDVVAEAIEEHRVVKHLVAELRTLAVGDEEFANRLGQIIEEVEHHVEEEETEMFPKARDVLSNELQDLGLKIQTLKQQLLATRSYPVAA